MIVSDEDDNYVTNTQRLSESSVTVQFGLQPMEMFRSKQKE